MEQAIQAKSHSIGLIAIASVDTAKTLLAIIIGDLVEYLNVGMTMSVNQISMTVKMILEDPITKNLKPEDFKVCFDQFKKSGIVYNRIDGQVIFNVVYRYANDRLDFTQIISDQSHENKKTSDYVIKPEVANMYKKALELRQENDSARFKVKLVDIDGLGKLRYVSEKTTPEDSIKINKDKKVIEKSPRDKFIQQQLAEFDKICDKKPSIIGGRLIPGRYTDMPVTTKIGESENGDPILETKIRPVDVTDFLKIKVAEYDLKIIASTAPKTKI